jgi:hypothetical protein
MRILTAKFTRQMDPKPVSWDKLDRSQCNLILDQNLERLAVLTDTTRPTQRFDIKSPDNQEVRANRTMFEFIVSKGIYNLEGLEKLFETAKGTNDRFLIQFPQGAKEIKAQWNPIPEGQKSRYLWRTATGPDGKPHPYGLVALHIITKDLPNWFWADFGHIGCESNAEACDNTWLSQVFDGQFVRQEPALTSLRDNTTGQSNGVRSETDGTVFQHYRLRGTQTNYERPSSITIYGVTGGSERWRKIRLDLAQPPVTFAVQAHDAVKRHPLFRSTAIRQVS